MPPTPRRPVRPYWQTADDGLTVRFYLGDVLDVLRGLPGGSVQCVVTSPPYWGLRSYLEKGHGSKSLELGSEALPDCLGWATGRPCDCCFVCRMTEVFRQVRRVLRDDGTVWLNLGDSYSSLPGGNNVGLRTAAYGAGNERGKKVEHAAAIRELGKLRAKAAPKQLLGVPWRVALALQADGWVLRQDIIWQKSTPMPESVTDRCTKAHEYVFLLAKGPRYFCDMWAIKERASGNSGWDRQRARGVDTWEYNNTEARVAATGQSTASSTFGAAGSANKRSVWTISSSGYPGAHFACFPPKLVEPCVLAGTSARGCCQECGAPWRRVVERARMTTRPGLDTKVFTKAPGRTGGVPMQRGPQQGAARQRLAQEVTGNRDPLRHVTTSRTVGWYPTCACYGLPALPKEPPASKPAAYEAYLEEVRPLCEQAEDLEAAPCLVLDPFCGSGTVGAVSLGLGRRSWGVDLSEEYLARCAVPRVRAALHTRPALAWLAGPAPGRVSDKVTGNTDEVQEAPRPTPRACTARPPAGC